MHPEFADDSLTMADFKSNVTDSTRVRGAGFNVDYSTATASEYVEIKPSPRVGPIPDQYKSVPQKKQMKTLTLDAFSRRKSANSVNADEIKQQKETIMQQRIEIKNLKEENEKLKQKLEETEKSRNDIRDKYENKMFETFQQQSQQMNDMKKQWEQQENNKQNVLSLHEDKLKKKDDQIHEKDILIANLNMLLDKRNTEIEKLNKQLQTKKKDNKNLETLLQHAIDSKMKSLVQSQAEIQKLKLSYPETFSSTESIKLQ